jgi:hypothetical protein
MHDMRRLRYLLLALTVALTGATCHSPTSPNDDLSSQPHGRLAGTVSIGPNCPGPTTTAPCPTPPDAYKLRKILVYNEAKTSLLHTVDIDSQGAYFIDLAPAKYTIDLQGTAADRTSDLPKTVEIRANSVTRLDVSIDTGLR